MAKIGLGSAILSALIVSFAVAFFATAATAQVSAVWLSEGNAGVRIESPDIVRALYSIPEVVRYRRVRLLQNEFGALLADKSTANIYLSHYDKSNEQIRNDQRIYDVLDSMVGDAFDNLLTKDEIAAQLERVGVIVKPIDWMDPWTYEMNDPTNIDGIATFTVASVCVINHQIVPTYNLPAHGVLGIPPCDGGRVYSVVKIAHIHYKPFCDDVPCRTPGDITNPVQIEPVLTTVFTSK